MNAVKKEQAELEKKIADINLRVQAIQKLRAAQQGPSAVLEEIKARFDGVPGLYLQSLEQKDAELIIKGESPNEAAVTRFGQSMEFSSGLFTNLNIETTREIAATKGGVYGALLSAQPDPNAPVPAVVAFTIKCSYARNGQQSQRDAPGPANPVAKNSYGST